jgi:DNA-binding transcriptional regulator YdaS (Cro superfamily)
MALNPVEKAIEKAGTQEALAKYLGVSRPAVALWKMKGEIPLKHIPGVSKATHIPISALMSKQQKTLFEQLRW